MKITVNLDDATVTSYLDHYNDVNGTDYSLKTLTAKQKKDLGNAFADLMEGEVDMRCDDHDGFESEQVLDGVL